MDKYFKSKSFCNTVVVLKVSLFWQEFTSFLADDRHVYVLKLPIYVYGKRWAN